MVVETRPDGRVRMYSKRAIGTVYHGLRNSKDLALKRTIVTCCIND